MLFGGAEPFRQSWQKALSRALVAILFGGAEPFMQFILRGMFVGSYLNLGQCLGVSFKEDVCGLRTKKGPVVRHHFWYRPVVSLASAVCKVLEHIVHSNIVCHPDRWNNVTHVKPSLLKQSTTKQDVSRVATKLT